MRSSFHKPVGCNSNERCSSPGEFSKWKEHLSEFIPRPSGNQIWLAGNALLMIFPWKPSFIGDFPLPCLIPGGKRHEGKHGMPRPRKTACWVAPRMGKPTQKQQRTTTFLGEMIWSSKPLDLGFSILSSLCWGFYRTHVFSPWNLGVFPGFPHVFGPPSACPSLQHREAQHFRLCMQLQ